MGHASPRFSRPSLCRSKGGGRFLPAAGRSLDREVSPLGGAPVARFRRCEKQQRYQLPSYGIWEGDNIPLLSRLSIAMALASDVAPLLSKERADEPGGLWATKQYGDLKVSAADLDYFSSSLVDVGVLYCAER